MPNKMCLISHNAKLAIVLSRNCWYIQATSTNRVWNKVNREETATPPGGKRTADGRAAATTHTVAAATADAEAKTIAAKSSWRNWKGRERSLLVTVQGFSRPTVLASNNHATYKRQYSRVLNIRTFEPKEANMSIQKGQDRAGPDD